MNPLSPQDYIPIRNLMVIGKTIPEISQMGRYVMESGDYMGLVKWGAIKPFELAIPILGPLVGIGWTNKIIRQHIVKETKNTMIDELGRINSYSGVGVKYNS